jgi:pyruvate dehydrogenase E2 component (dihydrolipoamide acetyltransferase)
MSQTIEVKVPDIGDFKDVPVIEILVKPGDVVKKDDSLVVLESDKATMEVPSVAAGVIKEIKVKVGDSVGEGVLIAILETAAEAAAPAAPAAPAAAPALVPAAPPVAAASVGASERAPTPASSAPAPAAPSAAPPAAIDATQFKRAHASPSIRRFARELGVDLSKLKGSGPHGRILQADVQGYVKGVIAQVEAGAPIAKATGGGVADWGLPAWPKVDFAKFGPVESVPLSRIKKISGPALSRNWVMIPHVTNHDEADITDLEAFRVHMNDENAKAGVKVTMLAFLIKASVAALKKFPDFNSSLDTDSGGANIIRKHYYHIGFAADTPQGLVVPVVKDADKKGILEIARETSELAAKARDGKLAPADMQGGTFSISSLGGIGGTAFTPIVNAPEVAILGVCKAAKKPIWDEKLGQFVPRLMLPLSLSWDHRVIDGASAARFNVYLAAVLADMRRVLL